jgi:hypothetical protein
MTWNAIGGMPAEGRSSVYRNSPTAVETWYDEDDPRTLLETLVDALAEAEAVTPIDIPPLYGTIDGEALARLIEGADAASELSLILSFRFETWCVFSRGDGWIRVCDASSVIDPEPVFE